MQQQQKQRYNNAGLPLRQRQKIKILTKIIEKHYFHK